MTPIGITVYSCDPDEAAMFNELGPRLGVLPTTTPAPVTEATVLSVPGNRCASVGHKSRLSEPMLRALKATGVEYISTRSIGFDHIDLDAAKRLDIAVANAVYAPDGVADYTLMLVLMAIRNAKAIISSAAKYDFRLASVRGKDLRDMTVGVVGVGHIGKAVIRRLQGFGCRVLAYNNGRAADAGAEFVSLDELLGDSDVVTLHVPLNAHTHHLIGSQQIATMKQGAFLINTGRGALVDSEALVVALESGALGGAALDVLEGEEGLFYFDCTNSSVDHRCLRRLIELPNAIVTPHTAFYTGRMLYDAVESTLLNCLYFERSQAYGEITNWDIVWGMV